MKALLLATLLLVPSCGPVGTAAVGTVSQVAPDAMAAAKKALIAAHGLHEATADSLAAAANANICKGACATQAKDYLDKSEAALKAADSAVALGDAPGINAKIAGATALISQVNSLISGGH